jgi:amino acid adenylation domain-containing protein
MGEDYRSRPSAELLHGGFELWASHAPERVAVSLAGRLLTYRQLNLRARMLAAELLAHGVGPGAMVGVCAERSLELVIALLAVLKAGAAYLPLDPSNPTQRIALLLADAKPLLLLADAPARARLGVQMAPTLSLEREAWVAEVRRSSEHPSPQPDPDDLAYVIYTSGSTGQPKGVMCTHRGIVNRIGWMQERYKLSTVDSVLHKTSIDFDVSLWELFWPLSVGARLVLASPGEQRHPEALADTICAEGVTVAHFVPAMLMGFISAGQLERSGDLHAVMCSGEALAGHVRDMFLARSTAELHNLYGPTEASVDVTHHTCLAGEFTAAVPIGRAIKGVEVHVLDERLNPVPDGEVGEIYIAGVALARGYLARAGLTAERFVPDPRGDGARLYRTGDRGRVRRDGELEFMGRRDDQVKIRGVRVELGEVEAVLAASTGVEHCAVVLTGGDSPHLVAYVVGAITSSERLRAELTRSLPEQAVPSRFVYLKGIPTLPSGKVDRGALLALDRPGETSKGDTDRHPDALPRTEAELILRQIWQVVLGIQEVSVKDNFFALGGDSIRSIEVVARARAAGLRLSTPDIFAHQTLGDLASCTGAETSVQDSEDAVPRPFDLIDDCDRRLLPSGVCDAMPLSSLLAGLVAESLENPHYLVYTTTLGIEGPYDASVLQRALTAMVGRHPALRSAVEIERFREPLQLVYETLPVGISEIDAGGLSGAAWKQSFAEWLAGDRRKRFEWSQPPLLRVTVHRRNGDCWQLTLSEPFLDGWSATLALTELLSIYRSYLCGKRPRILPAPRASNRDLLAGERSALRSSEQRAFWRTYLADILPTRLPRLVEDESGADCQLRVTVPISEQVACGLGCLARDLRVPLKSVLLAAHIWVLAALVGKREVVCGLMVNRRPEGPGGERVVGLFLNTMPLRMRVEPGSWSQLIHAAYVAEAEILPWRHYPYAHILRESGGQTLFDSVFNFTHFRPYAAFSDEDPGSGVKLLSVEGTDQTYFPLAAQFSLDPSGERVGLVLEVSPDRFAAPQVEQLVDLHMNALVAMLDRVESPHHLESLIGRRERGRRARWPVLNPRSPQDPVRLEQLFERRARISPEALAVFNDHEQLTYECLAARVDRLARMVLEHNGIAPRRVGVCTKRSPALVEAVLASLKLGAAFVPLDPSTPGERLDAVIGNAALDLVVADTAGAEAIAGAPATSGLGEPLHLEASSRVQASGGAAVLPAAGSPEDPAHIIYTSGSTGSPKGVLTTHLAVVNRLCWMWRAYPFRSSDVVCVRGSIGFVDSVTEIFNGLLCGVPTYIAPDEIREPHLFARAIGAAGVTRLTLVPALLRELLAGCDAEHRAALARISHWVLSGEPLSSELVAELRHVAPRATVLNLYGSTEVAGDVAVHECREQERDIVPVGIPVDGVRLRVLDPHGRDTPSGTVGETVVEGPALAVGYLDDPRMTAERFRPSPTGVGERLFCTGDLGRHRSDGVLEVLGRGDRQVKINGVRVEPAEVEAALLSHPLVRACAVVAAPLEREARRALVAHVEISSDGVDGAELRSFLRARLPSAMVPGTVLLSASLPRSANGKIDPRPLAAELAVSRRASQVAPRTALERTIAELVATQLGVETLMLEDDFFEQGGDSLAGVRLLGRLRERFEVQLALRDIFDYPTLGDLCARVELELSHRQASA